MGCQCVTGYTGNVTGVTNSLAENRCLACVAGKYKPVNGTAQCTNCLPGTHSPQPAAVRENLCATCGMDVYCNNGVHTLCSAFRLHTHTLLPARTSSADCICQNGYFLSEDDMCVECTENYYCTGINNLRAACTANSHAPIRSDNVQDCVCLRGFFENTGSGGIVQCNACSPGTYSLQPGASSQGLCDTCGMDVYCVNGVYTECSAFRFRTHTLLPARASSADCVCQTGYFLSEDDVCVQCTEDYYCAGNDNLRVACTANSHAPPGSDNVQDCVCLRGFFENTGSGGVVQCNACSPGTYSLQPGASSQGMCDTCGMDVYCINGVYTECSSFRLNTHTLVPARIDSVDCVCQNGYFLSDENVCVQCTEDYYCEGADNLRVACTAHSHSPPDSDNIDACVCGAGSFEDVDGAGVLGCELCLPGKYSQHPASPNASMCMPCGLDVFCAGGVYTECSGFRQNTYTLLPERASSSDCVCQKGRFLSPQSQCTLCSDNSFCEGLDNSRTPCIPNSYAPPGAVTVQECVCDRGSFQNRDTFGRHECKQCVAGKFSPQLGSRNDSMCAACGFDVFCSQGRYTECSSIRLHTHTLRPERTSSAECFCRPGYYLSDENLCVVCTENHYCGGQDNMRISCVAHSYAPAGSDTIEDCLCIPGYFEHNSSGVPPECRLCEAGTHSHELGAKTQSMCPLCGMDVFCAQGIYTQCAAFRLNTHTVLPGRTSSSDCFCRPGYFLSEDAVCTQCTENYYCDGQDNLRKNCTSNSNSFAGSVDERNCVCQNGYFDYTAANNGSVRECSLCRINSYSGAQQAAFLSKCIPCEDQVVARGNGVFWQAPTHPCDFCETDGVVTPPFCIGSGSANIDSQTSEFVLHAVAFDETARVWRLEIHFRESDNDGRRILLLSKTHVLDSGVYEYNAHSTEACAPAGEGELLQFDTPGLTACFRGLADTFHVLPSFGPFTDTIALGEDWEDADGVVMPDLATGTFENLTGTSSAVSQEVQGVQPAFSRSRAIVVTLAYNDVIDHVGMESRSGTAIQLDFFVGLATVRVHEGLVSTVVETRNIMTRIGVNYVVGHDITDEKHPGMHIVPVVAISLYSVRSRDSKRPFSWDFITFHVSLPSTAVRAGVRLDQRDAIPVDSVVGSMSYFEDNPVPTNPYPCMHMPGMASYAAFSASFGCARSLQSVSFWVFWMFCDF